MKSQALGAGSVAGGLMVCGSLSAVGVTRSRNCRQSERVLGDDQLAGVTW